jgi:Homeodomain-like domain
MRSSNSRKIHKYSTGTDGIRTVGRSPRPISYRSPLAGVLFSLQAPANAGTAPGSSADPAPLFVDPSHTQRHPGPDTPRRGIPPENWLDVLRPIEQGQTLRQIAKAYGVSYETVRRTVKAARRREGGM